MHKEAQPANGNALAVPDRMPTYGCPNREDHDVANQWKKGDVVMLRSGGARMTVTKVETNAAGETMVSCIWQETKGKGFVETQRVYDAEILASGSRSAIGFQF